jgi:hypothetical protein
MDKLNFVQQTLNPDILENHIEKGQIILNLLE